jgi:hypothetical protein
MSSLKDEKYLMTLLAAIVRQGGGEHRIPESTMESVTKGDMIGLLYDKGTKEIILKFMGMVPESYDDSDLLH